MWLEIMCPSEHIALVFILFNLVNSEPRNPDSGKKNQGTTSNVFQTAAIIARETETPLEKKDPVLVSQQLRIVSSGEGQISADDLMQGFQKSEKSGNVYVQLLSAKIKEPLPTLAKVNDVQEKVSQQWPLGVVPYFIDRTTYDPPTIKRIVKMMGVVESASCVVFNELDRKPHDQDVSWLHIVNPDKERECMHNFSNGEYGEIKLVLGFDCLYPNEILHSILHGIGFKDEVAHPHRDQYIKILWENIQPKYRSLYHIQFEDAPYRLVEYDPMSIMHFHDRAFSTNGAATIAPLVLGLQISPGDTLSTLDSMKLKLAFDHECNKRKVDALLNSCKHALLAREEHVDSDKEHLTGVKHSNNTEKPYDSHSDYSETKVDNSTSQYTEDSDDTSQEESQSEYEKEKKYGKEKDKVPNPYERIPHRFKKLGIKNTTKYT